MAVLPVQKGILDLWAIPASISATSKHVNWRYEVPTMGFVFFFYLPSSLVVTAAKERSKQSVKYRMENKEPKDWISEEEKTSPLQGCRSG